MLLAYQTRGRRFRRGRLLGRLRLLTWGKNRMQGSALHTGHKLDDAGVTHVLDKPVDDRVTQLTVGHLATFEAQGSLHFVTFAQETNCLIFLGLVVVLIDGHRKLHFLDRDDFLILARRAVALVLLVKEFPVILNAAHRRLSRGRNFHQIQATLAGYLQGFEGRQNSELFTVFVNDADFTRANSVVNADKRLGRTLIDGFLRERETKRPSNKA